MAVIQASDLTALINSVPLTDLIAQYARDNSFLKYVNSFHGGGLIEDARGTWDFGLVTSANTSRGVATETTTLTTAGQTGKGRMRYDQNIFYVTFGVSGLAQAKAVAGGYSYAQDLIASELGESMEELFDEVNDRMLSGSYANAYGVNQLIDNSGSFAGLTRGTNTYADAKVVSAGSTPLSASMMYSVHDDLINTRRGNYTEIWTNEEVLDQYESLLKAASTYYTRADVIGDFSFQNLSYKGRRIVGIPGYANRMDFVDPRNFWFQFLPNPYKALVTGETKMGPFAVKEMAKTTDGDTFNLILYGNFINRSPWKCGTVKNIKTT